MAKKTAENQRTSDAPVTTLANISEKANSDKKSKRSREGVVTRSRSKLLMFSHSDNEIATKQDNIQLKRTKS